MARSRISRILVFLLLLGSSVLPARAKRIDPAFQAENVEYLGTIPIDAAGFEISARVVDDYLYVSTQRNFSIYDVSDPLVPIPVSTTPLGFKCCNEDVATNGEILLWSETFPNDELHVWDVTNKRVPVEIAALRVDEPGEHTVTCILDCKWAYGSSGGSVFDLREPSDPKVAGRWTRATEPQAHDFEEVRPGFILSSPLESHIPIEFLDVRDPLHPKVVMHHTRTELGPDQWFHQARWPRGGRDRFVIMGVEGLPGPLRVYDAGSWKTGGLRLRANHVIPDDPAVTSHWFDVHPRFRDGGLVAVAWSGLGTRIFEVTRRGSLQQVGFFQMPGASASAAYWLSDEIVYSLDRRRGFDILRVTRG